MRLFSASPQFCSRVVCRGAGTVSAAPPPPLYIIHTRRCNLIKGQYVRGAAERPGGERQATMLNGRRHQHHPSGADTSTT